MKWPIRTRAPFLQIVFHPGTCTAVVLAIGSGDHRIEPNPIEPVCGYSVRHGLTWDSMGKLGSSKTFPSLLGANLEKLVFSSGTYRRLTDSAYGNSVSRRYSRFVPVDNFVDNFVESPSSTEEQRLISGKITER